MSIQLKDYVAAIYDKGGIGTEDILDGAITAEKLVDSLVYSVEDGSITTAKLADEAVTADKIASALKSTAITDLPASGNAVDDVAVVVNGILAALRKAGIIASA